MAQVESRFPMIVLGPAIALVDRGVHVQLRNLTTCQPPTRCLPLMHSNVSASHTAPASIGLLGGGANQSNGDGKEHHHALWARRRRCWQRRRLDKQQIVFCCC